ncbi:unnamed protein product [Soboliphyme baturini]|uniref:Uncharacterized protein n=1 Tax=Soboliphyme baturini TaxID=241478 RepID=A0A183IVT4_9BILA|nr:unnamed protein product [Soboliphyme baturini]
MRSYKSGAESNAGKRKLLTKKNSVGCVNPTDAPTKRKANDSCDWLILEVAKEVDTNTIDRSSIILEPLPLTSDGTGFNVRSTPTPLQYSVTFETVAAAAAAAAAAIHEYFIATNSVDVLRDYLPDQPSIPLLSIDRSIEY